MSFTRGTLAYQPRLDGVRALAVAFVIQIHFIPSLRPVELGSLGVEIFFVLSGYLISRIIFDYKRSNLSIGAAAGQFYWRRFLRLTPPLYLAIGLTALLGLGNMRQDWLWHVSYFSNFKLYIDGEWGRAAHFWTLATEEQFYLVWFFLLFITPINRAFALIVAGLAFGFFYRVGVALWWDYYFALYLLPGAIFFFCLGSLIAYAECFDSKLDRGINARFSGAPILVLTFIAAMASHHLPYVPRSFAAPAIDGLFSFCLIAAARNGAQGDYLRLLSHPVARHIGRISYGLYVYHYFVPEFFEKVGVREILRQSISGKLALIVLEVATTLIVAELSWWLMEQPISKWKAWRTIRPATKPS